MPVLVMDRVAHLHIHRPWSVVHVLVIIAAVCKTPQFTGLRSSFPCPDRLHGSGLQWGWLVLFQHVRGPIWEGWKAGAPTIRMLAPSQTPRLRCDDRRTGMLTALRGLSGSVATSSTLTSYVAVWAPRESVPATWRPYHFTVLS